MKMHRGMRTHDIVVLLKILTIQEKDWFLKDVAFDLGISQSEVSESLNRSRIAGLLTADKKTVMKNNLMIFSSSHLYSIIHHEVHKDTILIKIYNFKISMCCRVHNLTQSSPSTQSIRREKPGLFNCQYHYRS